MPSSSRPVTKTRLATLGCAWLLGGASAALAQQTVCEAQSGPNRTPVVELYTSEGCSSCPPADRWLSSLKGTDVVAQAFHVSYWDYIGWVDRFAQPEFTTRQRSVSAARNLKNIYTPQLMLNGDVARGYPMALAERVPAKAHITLRKLDGNNQFEARVTPAANGVPWQAYWTSTEDGHESKVQAGENSGEFLKHDFVVRQLAWVPQKVGEQVLRLTAVPRTPGHNRRINLVVHQPGNGETLQALSLLCPA